VFRKWSVALVNLLGPVFLVLLAALPFLFLKMSYQSALDYFIGSYRAKEFYSFNQIDFFFLLSFFKSNPLHILVLLFSWGYFFTKRRNLSRPERFILFTSLTFTVLILIHNQRYPFFIASLIPMIFLPTFMWLERTRFAIRAVLLTLCIAGGYSEYRNYFLNSSNQDQLEFIGNMEPAVEKDNLVYAEGLGLLPRQPQQVFVFPSPYDDNREILMLALQERMPDLIFKTRRLDLLGDEFERFLSERYFNLQNGAYVLKLSPDAILFKKHPSAYFIYRVESDGQTLTQYESDGGAVSRLSSGAPGFFVSTVDTKSVMAQTPPYDLFLFDNVLCYR
jgi:hypothetical protein